VLYLFAGNQRVASVLSDGRTQFYHPNHLGSASVITEQNGNRKEKMEYFPFGTYREAIDYDTNFPDVFYTFTGQEEDDELGLYNYKARLYDPVLGRFISPDRIVQAPENPQSLNRYSYCLNNPLIYTDPSGEFIAELIIVIFISAALGAVSAAVQGGSAGDILKGALIGAVSGAVGFGIGYEVVGAALASGMGASGTTAAVVQGVVGGVMGGATASALSGGNVLQGMLIGGISGGITGYLGSSVNIKNPFVRGLFKVGTSALIGGTAAELTGGDFAQGAMLGAISGAIVFGFQEIKGLREYAQNKGDQAQAEQKLVALGVDQKELSTLQQNPGTYIGSIKDPGREKYDSLLRDVYRSYPGVEDARNFDLASTDRAKFGLLHVRWQGGFLSYHYDRFDMAVRPLTHVIRDTLWEGIAHGNW